MTWLPLRPVTCTTLVGVKNWPVSVIIGGVQVPAQVPVAQVPVTSVAGARVVSTGVPGPIEKVAGFDTAPPGLVSVTS